MKATNIKWVPGAIQNTSGPGHSHMSLEQLRLSNELIEHLKESILVAADVLLSSEIADGHHWRLVAEHARWSDTDQEVLAQLIAKVCTHEHAPTLLVPLFEQQVVHLETYEQIAEALSHTSSAVRWAAYHHVIEAALYFNRLAYGRDIARIICPPTVVPAQKKVHRHYTSLSLGEIPNTLDLHLEAQRSIAADSPS